MTPRLPLRGISFEYCGYRDDRGATALPIDQPPSVRVLGFRV
jgi:hypothetical protein